MMYNHLVVEFRHLNKVGSNLLFDEIDLYDDLNLSPRLIQAMHVIVLIDTIGKEFRIMKNHVDGKLYIGKLENLQSFLDSVILKDTV